MVLMMKLAIVELIKGLFEWIDGDKRRLWQTCHYIKRGLFIIATMGKLRIPKKDYYNMTDNK